MIIALLICVIFTFFAWLVFFKFKWLKFTAAWAVVSAFVLIHVVLAILIGLRFVTPSSTDAKEVQYTIQLVPRLPEPTLVTAVLVEEGAHVKKGEPLFQFDRTVYEAKVRQLGAQLAQAEQNVKVLQADVAVAKGKQARLKSELAYDQQQKHAYDVTAAQGYTPQLQADLWNSQAIMAAAALDEADAELARATLNFEANFDGVNTTVAALEAELKQARYYLDNTTMVAPEDGHVVNLQVRPGMVS